LLTSLLIKPGSIELREVNIPCPQRGQALVKVKAALTCGTDIKAYLRGHPMIPMPGMFGHEFSGVVEAVGAGVKNFSPGDELMAVHSAPCLKCGYCKKKLYNLCEKIMDTKALGAFSEYILLPSHIVKINAYIKPGNLSFEEAAFLEPLSCVVHGVEQLGIKGGDSALVIGAGPIGLLHLLLLNVKGASVSVADINEGRLRVAKRLGADFILSPDSIKTGCAFDYVFECTGLPAVWELAVNYLKRGGTLALFGGCKRGTKATYDTYRIHYDEITLKGVFHYTPDDVKKAYLLLRDRKINVSGLISGRYPLKDIGKAFERLIEGKGIKYAIIP
jgi:L-iditol 2-dehydrogenase